MHTAEASLKPYIENEGVSQRALTFVRAAVAQHMRRQGSGCARERPV
jgi:hypothetical protein